MRITTDCRAAAAELQAGHLVAVPTETVYGLAARADDPHAVARIYAAKGRPADHPLIVHVAARNALQAWGTDIPEYANLLAEQLWPGPMTLVVHRSDRAGDFITGGQDTVAVRVSAHPAMRDVLAALIEATGDAAIGIAAPSANRFGRVSPTDAAHVRSEFAGIVDDLMILDGGPSTVGVESTIIDCTGEQPRILRCGAITEVDIERVTGISAPTSRHESGATPKVRVSGSLDSHYAPNATVRLVTATELSTISGDSTIGFLAPAQVTTPAGMVRLSSPESTDDYARVLYASLREADALGLTTILAFPPGPDGLGAAVIDRLTRASHGE